MNLFDHASRAGRSAGNRFCRLSLEQLERRDVPSAATFVVASAIVHSTESNADVITLDYARFLNRAPDTAGFNFLFTQMRNGVAPEVIEAEFVSSPEYIRNHGGVGGGWIFGVYHDLLGRLPSNSEVTFWNDELALGESTTQIGLAFSTSVERDAIVVSNMYFTMLGRAPDAAGLNFFVSALRSGSNRAAVESTILGSTEYFVDHGINDTNFVIAAYQDVLLRTPSNIEVNFWVQELHNLGG